MATITQLARQTASNEARLRKLSKDSAGKVLAQLPSDVPVYNLLADIGTTSEVVDRASTQGYITPSGNIKQMANNVLEPTFVDGRYGLEIYEAGENLALSPSDLTSDWVLNGTTSGVTELTEDSNNSPHGTYQTLPTVSGESYTRSVLVEKNSNRWVRLDLSAASFGTTRNAVFDLENGLVYSVNNCEPSIEEVSGGFICSVTAEATATTSGSMPIYLIMPNTTAATYQGDGVSSVTILYQQFEQSAFPTPFVDGTREACNVTADATDWFNPSEGTFVVSYLTNGVDNSRYFNMGITGSGWIYTRSFADNNLTFYINDGQGSTMSISDSAPQDSGEVKTSAVRYKAGERPSICSNGGSVETSSTIVDSLTPSDSIFYIGYRNPSYLNSTLYQLNYTPRAVSDEELQALSRRTR